MSKTLYLHIGHSKTGSSYLQEIFWNNRSLLEQRGILYPIDDIGQSNIERAGKNRFIGNAMYLFRQQERLSKFLEELTKVRKNVLLSSETVIRIFQLGEQKETIPFELIRAAGFDKISILLFVRDPLEHAVSFWQEIVKSYHSILYARLDDLIDVYNFPAAIQASLEKFHKQKDVTVTVRNYSVCKNKLLDITAEWLNLDPEMFVLPEKKQVNRSLQAVETDLLIRHKLKVDTGYPFKNMLMELETASSTPFFVPSIEKQEALWARNLPHITYISSLLPEEEAMSFKPLIGTLQDEGPVVLSAEQIKGVVDFYLHPREGYVPARKPRTLYLHLGHSKTGFSYLQETMWKNRDHFRDIGLYYPCDEFFQARLSKRSGFAFSGNAAFLFRQEDRLDQLLVDASSCRDLDVLLSTQTVMRPTLPDFEGESIPFDKIRRAGFNRVKLLLFVRDPVAHAVSLWSELIKNNWLLFDGRLDAFLDAYDFPEVIQRYLDHFNNLEGVEIIVRNYDVCKKELIPITEEWLGIPIGSLLLPDRKQTNRSLTATEVDLLLQHQRKIGDHAMLRDRLLSIKTSCKIDKTAPSIERQQALWERNAAAIKRINQFLPEGEKLTPKVMKGFLQGQGPISLEKAQIEELVRFYLDPSNKKELKEERSTSVPVPIIAYTQRVKRYVWLLRKRILRTFKRN